MLRYGIRLSVFVAAFILGLTLSFITPLFSPGAPARGACEKEILEVNRAYINAHINRDAAALDGLLADEFVIGGRYGGVTTKLQRLALLNDPVYSFIDINDLSPHVTATENYGEVSGYAVLTGQYSGQEATSNSYYFTRRFEKRDGHWQVTGVETYRSCGRKP